MVQSNVNLNFRWSPSAKPEWLTIQPTDDGFAFTVQENTAFNARGADLLIYTDKVNGILRQQNITIKQLGKPQF